MSISFDYHIPIPVDPSNEMKAVLQRMSVGASFIDKVKRDPANWRVNAKRLGMKVRCRIVDDGLYRIWRIS